MKNINSVKGDLTELADEHLETLNKFKDLQIIKQVQLQYEAERMSKKLGKDHPRTQQLNARLKKNLDIINALVVEGQIARIKVPEISDTDTLIHGRVTDRNYRGIWGVNTCLTDADEHIFYSLGIPRLDDTGYYSFVIDQNAFKKMSDVFDKGIFLAICSKKCKVIHRKCEPIKITERETLLIDLILDREELSKGREVREKPDTKEDKDDSKGNTLFTSEKAGRYDAGHKEDFDVTIKK